MKIYSNIIKNCVTVESVARGDGVFPALSPKPCGETPDKVDFAHVFPDGKLIVRCADGSAYLSDDGGENFTFLAKTDKKVFCISDFKDGEPRDMLVCGKSVHGGGTELSHAASCGVTHRGRLVYSDGERLYWSGADGAGDGEESLFGAGQAYICDGGKILQILNFCGCVAVVQEYAVTLFSAAGSPENFYLKDGNFTDAVIAGTARVAGGKVVFFTKSGLKACDGKSVKSVENSCVRDVSSPYCSCACGNLYFAGVKSKLLGRAALVYDAASGECYLMDIAVDAMCAGSGVFMFSDGKIYAAERGERVRFFCGINCGGRAVLSAVKACGAEKARVFCGGTSHIFSLAGGTAHIRMHGQKFLLEFSGAGEISGACAEAGYGV